MMKFFSKYKYLILTIIALAVFILYTVLVKVVDVQAIGPNGSVVGFASMNKSFQSKVSVNLTLYKITDYASFIITVPIGFIFLIVGIVEWSRRKAFAKVDNNVLALGCFYIITCASYVLFQFVKINYRPVLIDGELEASYPSSTTVLAITLLYTLIDQVLTYVKNMKLKITIFIFDGLAIVFLIVGRLLSGVHWLSDIIGGIILAITLCVSYYAIKTHITRMQTKLYGEGE